MLVHQFFGAIVSTIQGQGHAAGINSSPGGLSGGEADLEGNFCLRLVARERARQFNHIVGAAALTTPLLDMIGQLSVCCHESCFTGAGIGLYTEKILARVTVMKDLYRRKLRMRVGAAGIIAPAEWSAIRQCGGRRNTQLAFGGVCFTTGSFCKGVVRQCGGGSDEEGDKGYREKFRGHGVSLPDSCGCAW